MGDAGDDALGALLVELLRARGAATDQVRLRDGCSTSYSLVFEPGGEDRSFWHHVGANAEFDGTAVDLAGAGLLHVGYPSLLPALIAHGGGPLAALLERAKADGLTTSLDLAVIDPASPAARVDWPALLARVLPLVDVFSPSIDDVRTALHLDAGAEPAELRDLARRLLDLGPAIVMLTAGPAGLQLGTAGRRPAAGRGRGRVLGRGRSTSPRRRRRRSAPRSRRGTPRPRACSTGCSTGAAPGRRSSWRPAPPPHASAASRSAPRRRRRARRRCPPGARPARRAR